MKRPDSILLISIVIPVYNREKELKQTLLSIKNQLYRPIELILVDNNSQDQSLAVCKDFQKVHSDSSFDIKIFQETKKGANAARNTGMAEASGDYVLFFDSDDKMYTDCISTIVGQLIVEELPNAIAYPFYIRFPNGARSKRPNLFSNDPADQLFNTLIPTHGICIKRTTLKDIGPWDENIQRWQDLEYGFRVLSWIDDLIWFESKPLYEVVYHQDSISGNSYFADHEILYFSLNKISSIIEKLPESRKKGHQQNALCFKICSLGAQISKEGHPELGKEYLDKALSKISVNGKKRTAWLLNFQYKYESKGGRGFWRIARKLMQ